MTFGGRNHIALSDIQFEVDGERRKAKRAATEAATSLWGIFSDTSASQLLYVFFFFPVFSSLLFLSPLHFLHSFPYYPSRLVVVLEVCRPTSKLHGS